MELSRDDSLRIVGDRDPFRGAGESGDAPLLCWPTRGRRPAVGGAPEPQALARERLEQTPREAPFLLYPGSEADRQQCSGALARLTPSAPEHRRAAARELVGLRVDLARMALALHDELRKRLRAPTRPRAAAPLAVASLGVAPLGVAPLGVAPLGVAPLGVAPLAVASSKSAPAAPAAPAAAVSSTAADPPLRRKPAPAPRRVLAVPEWRFNPRRGSRPRGPAVDFNACCGDPEPAEPAELTQAPEPTAEPAEPVQLPETLEVTLPTPDVRVPLSAEESYLKDWYDESTKECAEEHVWVVAEKEDVPTVSFTEERLNEIGIPSHSSARLFWIQDKPDEFADRFGHWDPVGARWRILTKHSVVPVEQRIAPVGVGYGSTQSGSRCCETDSFVSHEYEETQDRYKSTALHSGLAYISAQLNALPRGTPIPVTSGWGCDAAGQSSYYTPHLRHVSIDDAISEEDGKRYVYRPGIGHTRNPVKPTLVEASWSSANACWVISGTSSQELGQDELGQDERAADALLGLEGHHCVEA